MNGQVWVESELNNGSTFYVALPIEEPAVEPQA
jgi:signal transduction histidine kinase